MMFRETWRIRSEIHKNQCLSWTIILQHSVSDILDSFIVNYGLPI